MEGDYAIMSANFRSSKGSGTIPRSELCLVFVYIVIF